MIPYAQRHFHAGFVRLGSEFGALLIVGGIGGCLGGGWIGDQWHKRSASGRVWTALIAILLEAGAIIAGLMMPSYSGLVACFAVLCIAAGAWTGVAAAIGLDILPPQYRGTGTAAYFLFTTLFGPGLGPFAVGLMSDRTGSLRFALAASSTVSLFAACGLIRLIQLRKSPLPLGA
jgi:MFS family permease